MDSHPQVVCDGELLIGARVELPGILKRRRRSGKIYKYIRAGGWNPAGIMEDFYAQDDGSSVIAFKAMHSQLARRRAREYLRKHQDIRAIHLRRENLLKQYVSNVLLQRKRGRGWWAHTGRKLPPVSMRISPKVAIKSMRRVEAQFQEFELLLSNHKRIEVVYEHMIEGECLSDQVSEAICDLLDIEHREMCCNLVKGNPNDLKSMVANYEELVDGLQGTEFERFLD
jgi:hypothetical protein